MTVAIEPASLSPRSISFSVTTGALAFAGVTSLGAGAIHAAAAGSHSEHRQAVITFVFVAAIQLGWGALALIRSGRLIALTGLVANGAAFTGWVMAKRSGIGFVDGLEEAETVQFADATAAAFALVAVVLAGTALVQLLRRRAPSPLSALGSYALALTGALVAALTLPSMVSAGSHTHAHGHTDGHEATTAADGIAVAAGDVHVDDGHSHEVAAGVSAGTDTAAPAAAADHPPAAAVAPVPYDPTKPIDLGGVPGVTPEQQARAENLVAISLARLPKFADVATAEALGWRSIGDGLTGHEHYVNWSLLDDGRVLDPDFPESLVYEVKGGTKTLVSAMFMLDSTATLETAPDIGGALTQWHIHDNLCFLNVNGAARVVGLTDGTGGCRIGEKSENPVPMIHVWITPHPCGPFAALEGVAAGQVKPGETHLCDHAHGASG